MLYREIIAFYSEDHTKHINTQCGQNVGFVIVILFVYIPNTELCNSKAIDAAVKSNNGHACGLCAVFLCSQIYYNVPTAASSLSSNDSNLFIVS
jgi:hypothetical protein